MGEGVVSLSDNHALAMATWRVRKFDWNSGFLPRGSINGGIVTHGSEGYIVVELWLFRRIALPSLR